MRFIIENIKKERERQGFSKEFIATHIGLSIEEYNHFENGFKISVNQLNSISKVLGNANELLKQPFDSYKSANVEQRLIQRFKELRKQRHWSIRAASIKLGFKSQASYQKIESGEANITIKHLLQMSELFDTSPVVMLQYAMANNQ